VVGYLRRSVPSDFTSFVTMRAKTTAPSRTLTLRDLLSRLTYGGARRLLGPRGDELLRAGRARELDLAAVALDQGKLRVELPDAVVTVSRSDEQSGKLLCVCSTCDAACEHAGATLSLVLEEKTALGLAAPPSERVPAEALSEEELVRLALEEREERARSERMTADETPRLVPRR
jgi:hypothetical protein